MTAFLVRNQSRIFPKNQKQKTKYQFRRELFCVEKTACRREYKLQDVRKSEIFCINHLSGTTGSECCLFLSGPIGANGNKLRDKIEW